MVVDWDEEIESIQFEITDDGLRECHTGIEFTFEDLVACEGAPPVFAFADTDGTVHKANVSELGIGDEFHLIRRYARYFRTRCGNALNCAADSPRCTKLARCCRCGKFLLTSNGESYVTCDDGCIRCAECAAVTSRTCGCCHSETWNRRRLFGGMYVCLSCYEELDVRICDRCGVSVMEESATEITVQGARMHLCPDCMVCKDEFIASQLEHPYNYKPLFNFLKVGGEEAARYFGVELEMDDGNKLGYIVDANEYSVSDSDGELFYFMHDGSLNEGVETATMPMTLEYAFEKFPFDDISRCAERNKMESESTWTCGMHIHVSKAGIDDYESTLCNLTLVYNIFYEKLRHIGRRERAGQYMRWSKRPGVRNGFYEEVSGETNDHYCAVNSSNRDTIEFRLWQGTTDPSVILASIDFLNALITVCEHEEYEHICEMGWKPFLGECIEKLVDKERTVEYLRRVKVM